MGDKGSTGILLGAHVPGATQLFQWTVVNLGERLKFRHLSIGRTGVAHSTDITRCLSFNVPPLKINNEYDKFISVAVILFVRTRVCGGGVLHW